MKRILYLFFFATLLLCGCETNELPISKIVKTEAILTDTAVVVTMNLYFNQLYENRADISEYGVYFSTEKQVPSEADNVIVLEYDAYKLAYDPVKREYYLPTALTVVMKNLADGTTYYVRAFVRNPVDEMRGEVVSFTTPQAPQYIPTLADFIGTYNIHANCGNGKYDDWQGVEVTSFFDDDTQSDWIYVNGLVYGNRYDNYFTAMGKFEADKGYAHLYGDWFNNEGKFGLSGSGRGDTLFYAVFTPIYVNEDFSEQYYLSTDNPIYNAGEILLKRNDDGTLYFTPSESPDVNNRYANSFVFLGYYADDVTYAHTHWGGYLLEGTTMTKTSSSVSAPKRGTKKSRRLCSEKELCGHSD